MDGDGLKIIRKGYKLTQAEMAGKLGVSRQSYIAWEKGTYRIPKDITDRLVAGDVALTGMTEDPTALITVKNHPECFEPDGKLYFLTLAHPRWYLSSDCPLRHRAPEAMRNSGTAIAELATHVAPSVEAVLDLLLHNWPTAANLAVHKNNGWMYEVGCKNYLKRLGRPDLLAHIPHDATNDANPVAEAYNPTPEQLADFQRLKDLADSVIANLPSTPSKQD